MSTLRGVRSFFVLAALASSLSCSKGYVGQNCPANVQDVSTEGSGRGCGTPSYFLGSGRPGDTCTSASDCAPVCCGCANGNGAALAAACIKNKCGTEDELCCGYDKWSDICRRGPSSQSFHTCDNDSECESGLSCIKRYQVTSSSGGQSFCEDPFNQRICTRRCSGDSECTAYNGACSASDSCGGSKNLCHNK